tara:strand:+ start:1037 stop:1999 length:963 start_codon:yes stop_codon:yes gene_type:complete
MEKILVTGSSGFIGMHLCKKLLDDGYSVFGIDNMNNYYDLTIKEKRLKILLKYENFKFFEEDISDLNSIQPIFKECKPEKVVNLAAQAGVRYSLENPQAYIHSNIVGFMNILEVCREQKVKGFIYASSSSVYGGNKKIPFSIEDKVDSPISIYAASKKANELMAHSYSHLYGLNTTGLRFFTVYGPWGRPDMSYYMFCDKVLKGKLISVFNDGDIYRDFTFIDDIIDGTISAIEKNYNCEIFNLGNNVSENIMNMVHIIEKCLGKKAIIKFKDMQPGDVKKTHADIQYSKKQLDYNPITPLDEGIPKFIDWYKTYHQIKI